MSDITAGKGAPDARSVRSDSPEASSTEPRSFAPQEGLPANGDGAPRKSLTALAVQTARSTGQELRGWANAKTEGVTEAVENRPVTAVAIAFGVGVIIGLLAQR